MTYRTGRTGLMLCWFMLIAVPSVLYYNKMGSDTVWVYVTGVWIGLCCPAFAWRKGYFSNE